MKQQQFILNHSCKVNNFYNKMTRGLFLSPKLSQNFVENPTRNYQSYILSDDLRKCIRCESCCVSKSIASPARRNE